MPSVSSAYLTGQASKQRSRACHRISLQRVVQQVTFPTRRKQAIVRPLLNIRTMDVNDAASYRPISNLSFLSKTVEKVVDDRLTEHLESHRLIPTFQSAYRQFHSTETAVVSILNDMITAVDRGRIGDLMLLDLSAAFDTVDHSYCSMSSTDVSASPAKLSAGSTRFSVTVTRYC